MSEFSNDMYDYAAKIEDDRAESTPRTPKRDRPKCPQCQQIIDQYNGFGPSHDGSPLCKSGSIASGGNRAHCTCDTCF